MVQLNTQHLRQIRPLYAASLLACLCVLSFAVGCNGGKATGASQPTFGATPVGAATQKVETKYLCKSKAFGEDHYFVDLTAKTVRTDSAVAGGPNGVDKWAMKKVSITEDSISFTQQIDYGAVVLTRSVAIGRKDRSFTNNGTTEGTCTVVQKF
jgi:hypothetical protein